jgi:hypothetical protein
MEIAHNVVKYREQTLIFDVGQARSVEVYKIYYTEAWSLRNLAPQASSEQWLGSDCKNYKI